MINNEVAAQIVEDTTRSEEVSSPVVNWLARQLTVIGVLCVQVWKYGNAIPCISEGRVPGDVTLQCLVNLSVALCMWVGWCGIMLSEMFLCIPGRSVSQASILQTDMSG